MGVVDDVQAHLAAAGLVDGETGWLSIRGALVDTQDQVVGITEDGGSTPETSRATGIGDAALKAPGALVTVRAARRKRDDAFNQAQAIWDELHGKNSETLNGTDYLSVRARTPEPVFAGQDDSERPIYTVAFVLQTDA